MAESIDYHSTTMYREELDLFDAPNWLNDNTVAFVNEWLAHERFPGLPADIVLMHPGSAVIAQLEEGDDLVEALSGLGLQACRYAFLPLNNNPIGAQPGGTHWSLLVFVRRGGAEGEWHHFDSHRPTNNAVASRLARVLSPLCSQPGGPAAPAVGWPLREHEGPQQTNFHDCGAFALVVTEFLLEGLLHEDEPRWLDDRELRDLIDTDMVREKREEYKRVALREFERAGE